MNEANANLRSVRTRRVACIVAELVFLLGTGNRELGDRCRKLVVAKRLEARNRLRRRAERKRQSESQVLVPRLRMAQRAGIEGERPHPLRSEGILSFRTRFK